MHDALGISAIIPVFNCERYLGAAIESILAQDWPPMEIIVVDDGSTDSSLAVASEYPVRCVSAGHAGAGAARNRGVEAARGECLAFLDADDLWVSGKLARQIESLELTPRLDAVFMGIEHFISPELPGLASRLKIPDSTLNGYLAGSMLIRREAFDRVGPFREDLPLGEFIEWFARAREKGLEFAILPEIGMRRRLHAANMMRSAEPEAVAEGYFKILRETLERRRSARAAPSGEVG